MADEEQKAEEQAEGESSEKKGGLGGALVMGAVVLGSGGAGFAVPYLAPGLVTAQEAEGQEVESPAKLPEEEQAYIEFEGLSVNLDEGRLNRYLRVSFSLLVDKSKELEITAEVEKKKLKLKNWLLSYLADKSMDEIRGAAGLNRVRREVQDHFNEVLFPDGNDGINDILFNEFNIQ